MIEEKYKKDIQQLVENAKKQGNQINLSMVQIALNPKNEDLQLILNYFSDNEIEVINSDIEPEYTNSSENDSESDSDIATMINPFDPSKIDIKMDKVTMDMIIKRIGHKEIEFDSSFQRKSGLWKKNQKSQLIESVLLRIPLPAFYFDASNDNKWLIIDGLQRLSTIREFIVDKSFSLTGMEFLKGLNGLKFDELPRSLQRRIEETNINAYLVNPATPSNVKFNIFKRINTGGLVLEAQEIRNALYQGQASEFIFKLSKLQSFITATAGSIKADRMLDREFCLRYITITRLTPDAYHGISDDHLNNTMEYLNKIDTSELDRIQSDFEKNMGICKSIFANYAFRKMATDNRRRPINKALFEAWSYIISTLSENDVTNLIQNKTHLIKKFIVLCEDYPFQNALKASDKKSLNSRVDAIKNLINVVLKKEL